MIKSGWGQDLVLVVVLVLVLDSPQYFEDEDEDEKMSVLRPHPLLIAPLLPSETWSRSSGLFSLFTSRKLALTADPNLKQASHAH